MTPLNPPLRVGDEVIFWNARKLTKAEQEKLARGETVKLAQPQPGALPWWDEAKNHDPARAETRDG